MVALLGLLDLGEVGVEVLLVEEGGAVDALEHHLVGVALPVGPGDRQELERADLARVGDVRAAAEVDELALAVEAEDAVLVQLVVDVLDLVALAEVLAELAGVGDGQGEPLEGLGLLDDPGHLGLDGREVVLREGVVAGQVDVVIEAGGGGRPEGEAGPGEEPEDGPRHDVRRRVPQHVERLAVLRGQQAELDRTLRPVLERPVEVDDRPVGDGGDGRVGEPPPDPLGDLARADPLGVFLDRAVRQLDLDHHPRPARGPAFPCQASGRAPPDPQRRSGPATPIVTPGSQDSPG